MIRQVEEALGKETIDTSKLALLKCSLQEKLETIRALDGEIVDLIEDDKLTEEIEQADSYKETIYNALLKIEKSTSKTTPPSSTPHASDTSESTRPSTSTHGKGVKLPKLALRSFDGDITAWYSFWDSYESTIHKNEDLANVDSAREAVSGLTVTAANYLEAVSILQKRFGSRQQIISRHMDILLNVEPVASSNNIKALHHLCDLVESHIRGLKALGVTSDSYGSLLSPVLLNKLPTEMKLIVSREVSEEESGSLDALMKEMRQEIEPRTKARRSSDEHLSDPHRRQPHWYREPLLENPFAVIASSRTHRAVVEL